MAQKPVPAGGSPFSGIPDTAELARFAVNRQGAMEANTQSLYDSATYAAAGQSQLLFFQTPKGQSGKTAADTNMESAGALPNPKQFLLQSLEVHFFPGSNPGETGAAAAAPEFVNDVYTFFKSGWLELFIGSKAYLTEAPIGRFPPKTRLDLSSSIATTVAGAQVDVNYAASVGRPYLLKAPILLQPTQNFSVSLNWPTAVALPSTVDARVVVILDGLLYRLSQ
jgi:hypothetical protein